MGANAVWCVLAILLAFVSAFFCMQNILTIVRYRLGSWANSTSTTINDPVKALFAWRVRNGIAILKPFGEQLLRFSRIEAAVLEMLELFEEQGYPGTLASVASLLLAGIMTSSLVVGLTAGDIVAGAAVGLCLATLLVIVLSAKRDRRNDAARDSVVEALDSLAACFGSGMTLVQTFRQVAADTDGELGRTFGRCANILDTGGSTSEALDKLKACDYAPELAFVAVALEIHHQSGGSIGQVLEAAADSAKSECSLRRSLRVQTAQARLSARVVAVMPLILVAAFSVASPGFLNPFFESLAGYALLLVAAGMQVTGIVLVRRTLSMAGAS